MKAKKFLSLLISVAMLLSCININVFATSAEASDEADLQTVVAEIEATSVENTPSGVIRTGVVFTPGDTGADDGSYIYFDISELNASESIEIKLYSGEELLSSTILNDAGKEKGYLALSSLSAKVEITDDSSSWDTTWVTEPISNKIPDRAVLYVDGVRMNESSVNMYNTDYPENAREWAAIDGVKEAPKGTITIGYTSETAVWGEGTSNSRESFVVELYAEDVKIGSASLNNIGEIIDGDVFVTWSIPFAGSTDEYWTVEWAEGYPTADVLPTKVVLVADGVSVAENVVQMNGPDNMNKVEWEKIPALDPNYITSLAKFKAFRDSVNSGNTYKGEVVTLAADIDLESEEWTPIGNSTNNFLGTFDGGNHTISNLVITGYSSNVGLFGFTSNGEVKNLNIHNALVSGRLNVGAMAGTPYTTKYTNIKLTGHVEINGMSYVGGVFGKNVYANITGVAVDVDEESYVKAVSTENGTAYRTYVGGVIGFMGEGGHTVSDVTSNINVIGDVCDVGGITGIAHYGNNFKNIVCTGTVTNTNKDAADAKETGGIAGVWHNGGSDVTFEECYFDGTVEAVGVSPNAVLGSAYDADGSGAKAVENTKVAKLGSTKYENLSDAIAAAQNGDVVTIIADGTYKMPSFSKNITIEAVSGVEVTFDMSGAVALPNSEAVFNNLAFAYQNVDYTGLQHIKTAEYNNCTFSGQPFLYGQKEVFNNCVFTQISPDAYNVWTYGAAYVEFNECTFNSAGKSVLVYNEGACATDLSVESCSFNASQKVEGKAAIEIDTSLMPDGTEIAINNSEATGFDAGSVSGNSLWNDKKDQRDLTISVDNEKVWPGVAAIGASRYASLWSALDAAGDSEEIVIDLLADATYDIAAWDSNAIGGVNTKTVTINGNNHNLTFNQCDSDWNNVVTANDAKLILNNMTIANSGYNDGPWNRYDINFGCNVELNNVISAKALAFKADATLNNVSITEENDAYAIWIQANGQKISINGLTINSKGRGIKIDEQYVDNSSKVSLSVENAVFATTKKAAILVKNSAGADIAAGANVDITNVAADNVNLVWVDSDAPDTYEAVNVTNASMWLEDGVPLAYLEVNGNKKHYFTLESAVRAAAETGEAIELLTDITVDETVKLEGAKKIIINGNGYTVTGTARKTFEVHTPSAQFNNMTIINTAVNGRCVDTRRDNTYVTIKNSTLEALVGNTQPVTVGGTNTNDAKTAHINIQYSKINAGDSGYGVIVFQPGAEINITASEIEGYAALYLKEESKGAVVNIGGKSYLTGNNYAKGLANSFGTIVFEASDVVMTVAPYATLAANNYGDQTQSIFDIAGNLNTITMEGKAILNGDNAFVMSGFAYNENYPVTVSDALAAQLRAESYIVENNVVKGMLPSIVLTNAYVKVSGITEKSMLILSTYDERGRLMDVELIEVESDNTIALDDKLDLTTENTKTVKAALWNGMSAMVPLCEAKTAIIE